MQLPTGRCRGHGPGAVLGPPGEALPGRELLGSLRNWHLWFDRLWERVCCTAQQGTRDYGRKLSHPEVGRDKEPRGAASYSLHRQHS